MQIETFNHIILPMRDELRRYALRLTGADDNAEDLVQEVMLRLWSMRERLGREDNIKALALTILRNRYYDECRHEQYCEAMADVVEMPTEDMGTELRDEVRLIKRIVAELPPLQQQIFRMKEIDGYESEEIRLILGCSADNLRRNLSRARMKIRERYMEIIKGGKS